MRKVLTLFVAVMFMLYSSMLAAAPAHACCKAGDCPVAQCVMTDCLPSAMPAALGVIPMPAIQISRAAAQSPAPTMSPAPANEVWCPPD
jgi:hypothetical protein